MKLTVSIHLTHNQAKALIHAISTCLHLVAKSLNTAYALGFDFNKLEPLNASLSKIEDAIPHESHPS